MATATDFKDYYLSITTMRQFKNLKINKLK